MAKCSYSDTKLPKYYVRLQTAVAHSLGWPADRLVGCHTDAAPEHSLCYFSSVNLLACLLIVLGLGTGRPGNFTRNLHCGNEDINIKWKDEKMEQVNTYQYLGTIISSTGSLEDEINNRVNKANGIYYRIY